MGSPLLVLVLAQLAHGANDVPSRKDVVIATVGASAALAGLVLVFLGLVIASYQSFPGDTVKAVKAKQRDAAWPIFAVFVVCTATIGLGVAWLAIPAGTAVFRLNLVFFAAELVSIVAVAVTTVRQLLK